MGLQRRITHGAQLMQSQHIAECSCCFESKSTVFNEELLYEAGLE